MHKERKKCLFRYTYDILLIAGNKREARPLEKEKASHLLPVSLHLH